MTGFGGRTPGASLVDRIRAGQVGGVILFKSNIAGTDRLRSTRGRSSPAS
jgi:hypothetical protein